MEYKETREKFEMTGTAYDNIFMQFMYFYGDAYPEIVRWEPFDKMCICAYNADGTKVFYDGSDGIVKNVGRRQEGVRFVDDELYMRRFAWRLRVALNASQLSRAEICERTGISQGSLSGYLNGRTVPSITNVFKLARVLDCPFEDLVNACDIDL